MTHCPSLGTERHELGMVAASRRSGTGCDDVFFYAEYFHELRREGTSRSAIVTKLQAGSYTSRAHEAPSFQNTVVMPSHQQQTLLAGPYPTQGTPLSHYGCRQRDVGDLTPRPLSRAGRGGNFEGEDSAGDLMMGPRGRAKGAAQFEGIEGARRLCVRCTMN